MGADGGLADMEQLRRFGKAAGFHHAGKRLQLPKLHESLLLRAIPQIKIADKNRTPRICAALFSFVC
ncbi:hypothetical protein SDC9_212628 [bioreactor metagenome]|uniref:Uncharacterized protein n=1 Tax=bioreactor metagenome TaxID=1076179 RepID=A0A645JP54_9ZZZZ